MTFQLGKRSEAMLTGVHPDLIRVVRGAILHSAIDFAVVDGVRSLALQREYFRTGKSRTMKSRHLPHPVNGFGHAVDLMPYGDFDGDGDKEGSWERKHFWPIVDAMRASAAAAGVLIEWGGDAFGPDFIDMPHWQLPWSKYP
jgi:peptidoglycan L-alanyl-D-glutamate endopeptidase CwlK